MFSDIIRIQRGRHTATFSRSKAGTAVTAGVSAGAGTGRPLEPTEEDDKAFSIICEANTPEDRTSLDLVANSPEECDAWCVRPRAPLSSSTRPLFSCFYSTTSVRRVSGLQLLMFSQRVGLYDGDLKLLCRAFDKAPKHKSGQLTYDQVS